MQTSDYPAAAELQPGEPRPQLRAAALTAVIAGLVLVAGAAFVLSYQGIHQLALNAGVTPELARLYPVILDAMLVMSGAAALALRTAGVWTRCYVWACLILLLAVLAAGNAVYALNISLPAQPTRAVAAVLPWALLLMGFGMLLAMLRHWRRIQVASAEAGPAVPGDGVAAATLGAVSGAGSPGSGPGAPRSGIGELMEPRAGQPPERAGAAAAGAAAAGAAGARAAIAGGEAADGKRPGPAASPQSTGTSGQDDAAPRPPGGLAEERPDVGPAVSYDARPMAPAGTAGPARANGPAGATQPAAATQPTSGIQPGTATPPTAGTKPGTADQPGAAPAAAATPPGAGTQAAAATQPTGDTQPAKTAGTTGPGQAPTPVPGPGAASPDAAGTTGAGRANGSAADTPPAAAGPAGPASADTPAGNVRVVTPPAGTVPTAPPPGQTVPMATPPAGTSAAADPPAEAVPAPTPPAETTPATPPPEGTAATPPAGPVPAAAAAADAVPRPPDTAVPPFLDRILGGPTNPNAPEADGG